MKLKTINLYNFGSYEGKNTISFEDSSEEKRVVVIGGKNGAGKTTLFTALQICLYGYHSFGFKSTSKQYFKEVYNLINNKVRLDECAAAYVEVVFEQITDTEKVIFEVKRLWTWLSGEIEEQLIVTRDGNVLEEDELANFQNFLVHLIPPELLKLYFFDGEKVADYFLGNKEVNIRDALMVLSGNDTFDLLYESVKRTLKLTGGKNEDSAKEYLECKQAAEELDRVLSAATQDLEDQLASLDEIKATLTQLVSSYAKKGGISLDEWSALQGKLKEEDSLREKLNSQKKAIATDILPFLIVAELVKKIPVHMQEEKEYEAYKSVQATILSDAFSTMLSEAAQAIGSGDPIGSSVLLDHIKRFFSKEQWVTYVPLFGLSGDEELQVQMCLSKVDNTDLSIFQTLKKQIDESIERSKIIRSKLQESDVEHFEEHIRERAKLESEQDVLGVKIERTRERILHLTEERTALDAKMKSAKKAFEEQLKQQSVSAVSGRVLLLLEDLQRELYSKLIQKVEIDINEKFRQLIRKRDFFSCIKIDENFNLHILRYRDITKQDLLSQFKGNGFTALQKAIGPYAVCKLQELLNVETYEDLKNRLKQSRCESYWLPFEIDKDRLSSGEKQIFVMSLYWAMMQQSKNSLPYVIDTPFARIDTEHRANITDYFFKQLNGQLIVLSTDEEISGYHMTSLKEQIAHIYMLEYGEDKCTHIQQNVYFEV